MGSRRGRLANERGEGEGGSRGRSALGTFSASLEISVEELGSREGGVRGVVASPGVLANDVER